MDENSKSQDYQALLLKLKDWLVASGEEDVKSARQMVEQAKAYLHAAEELSKDEIDYLSQYLTRDLSAFWQEQKNEAQSSPMWQLLKDEFWHILAEMTDRCQVEWNELAQDFKHTGVYHTGDMVGFGRFQCKSCQDEKVYYHSVNLSACEKCGAEDFQRFPLEP